MSDAYIVRRGKIIQGGGGNMQSKTVTPTASGFTVTPDSGYDGLSSVIVNGDADLEASNIKSGINIFGVTGSYGGGGGFDPSGAVLKVVTSTGCSVTVTGTGYSQTQQDGEGFPRSDDANVTEHFFSIPASAFGNFTVTATNTYGTNTKQILGVNTADKVYEVLISAPNILLNQSFGKQEGLTFTMSLGIQRYDEDYRCYYFERSNNKVELTTQNYDVIPYDSVTIKGLLYDYVRNYDAQFICKLFNKDNILVTEVDYIPLASGENFEITIPITDKAKSPHRLVFFTSVAQGSGSAPNIRLNEFYFS